MEKETSKSPKKSPKKVKKRASGSKTPAVSLNKRNRELSLPTSSGRYVRSKTSLEKKLNVKSINNLTN